MTVDEKSLFLVCASKDHFKIMRERKLDIIQSFLQCDHNRLQNIRSEYISQKLAFRIVFIVLVVRPLRIPTRKRTKGRIQEVMVNKGDLSCF